MAQLSPTAASISRFSSLGPRSLTETCLKVAIKNIEQIDSLGDLPPEYAVRMIRYVKTAEQLRRWELDQTDDIYNQTEEFWMKMIQKQFPSLARQHNFQPKEKRHWHKVYAKYKQMADKEVEDASSALAEKMAAMKNEKTSRQAKVLSVPDSRRLPVPKERTAAGRGPHWSTLPKEKKSFLSKTKKQVAAQQARFKVNTPIKRAPIGKVLEAPASMLRDARVERQFDAAATLNNSTPIHPASQPATQAETEAQRLQRERESRLLSIKGKGSGKPANVVEFSDDEDDIRHGAAADDADIDLFGESETDNSARGWALSIDELESDFSSSASKVQPSSSSQRRPTAKPRSRLLSAAPGSNAVAVIMTSPAPEGNTLPSLSSPGSSQNPTAAQSAGGSNPPPPKIYQRRAPNRDPFMRPAKRVRH
ncbi:hypothetical protein QBC35DRAFT_486075 [Podospora australis]|uniref:Elongin-A n=1 Tax=Podospora australis TaxID=1536484 RepID=A0AAN6X1Y0_9PEZI|nr:hypothetical protein QBC35DRAFT_486075 [Podospora australis]